MENTGYYILAIFILITVPILVIVGKKGRRANDNRNYGKNANYRKKKKG